MPSELEKEIDRALRKQSRVTLLATKESITEIFNDRPRSYNHRQRTEFYNDVIEVIDGILNKLEQDLKS